MEPKETRSDFLAAGRDKNNRFAVVESLERKSRSLGPSDRAARRRCGTQDMLFDPYGFESRFLLTQKPTLGLTWLMGSFSKKIRYQTAIPHAGSPSSQLPAAERVSRLGKT